MFVIFISIVTLIYGFVNFYIFSRGVQVFSAGSAGRLWFTILFWLVASTFVAARILERVYPCAVTGVITWIGSFWLAFLLYFFLISVLIDFGRILNYFFGIFPQVFYSDYSKTKMITFIISVSVVSLLVIIGYINARNPRIHKLDLHINKVISGNKKLNMVMVSDIHLGTLISKHKASKLVSSINALSPDIVLFAGDVVDEDLAPVIKNNLGADLTQIKSKFGVFAIPGNHEYIGGAEAAVNYLRNHGITILRDTALLIDQRFYLVGRDDRDKERFSGKTRKGLNIIMQGIDHQYPVILLDHQPFDIPISASSGVDLQLSGHTHHGQLWPFNYITNSMYEVSWGYKKVEQMHLYVSSGYGTWGPPVRLGNRPEIVNINLIFN